MKTWDELVATELRSYLRWLRALESDSLLHPPYYARRFKGKLLELYTRAGRDYYGLKTEPFVCFADIQVKAEYRGMKLFSHLLQHVDKHRDQLRATNLVVESVGNTRLASKLISLDFSRFALHGDSAPTFYRRLDGVKSPNFLRL